MRHAGNNLNQLVAPLFILMAEFLSKGEIAAEIYELMNRSLGRKIKGGLAVSTTLACTVFAALCGSSPATAASIGRMSISQMTTRGYRPSFAVGTVAAGGTLGLMIPPSIAFVTYGIITENSISKLLMAGLLPGIMLSLLLCASIVIRVRLNPGLIGEAKKHDERMAKAREAAASEAAAKEAMQVPETSVQRKSNMLSTIPAFVLIIIVLGALYLGIATPTEAAGYGAIGAMIIVIVKRRMTKELFLDVLSSAAKTSCLILFLIIMGFCLSYAISYLGLASSLAQVIVGSGFSAGQIMLLLYILWFVLGCLMDPGSMIILTIPFVYPTIMAMGIDPIWLGVVSTLCVEIGMITPPVGLNLFVLGNVSGVKMSHIIRGALPFVGVLIVGLVLLCMFPGIALFLPSRM